MVSEDSPERVGWTCGVLGPLATMTEQREEIRGVCRVKSTGCAKRLGQTERYWLAVIGTESNESKKYLHMLNRVRFAR